MIKIESMCGEGQKERESRERKKRERKGRNKCETAIEKEKEK